jgi:hypothetical protein
MDNKKKINKPITLTDRRDMNEWLNFVYKKKIILEEIIMLFLKRNQ